MKRNVILQGGTLVVSIILAVSFFMLLTISILNPQSVIISLILIVIAIIMLNILSILNQIQEDIRRSKR